MKYYIIAGEASGDLHASNMMRHLKQLDSNFEFRCWGGDLMKNQGGTIVKHYKDLAFMGIVEVARNISTILNNMKFCKADILSYQPDALVLVDYPGFNLRIAKFAKKNNIKVYYYISPTVWAWKQSRVYNIKRDVTKMFVILPFEKQFYAKFGVDATYVGHPLLDVMKQRVIVEKTSFLALNKVDSIKTIVALLPGSRMQEISKMMPCFVEVARLNSNVEFLLACAPSIDKNYYLSFDIPTNVHLAEGETYNVLSVSDAALVCSGTASLETALMRVPQVVCYTVNSITFAIAKSLVKVKYVSLANLILNKLVFTELIQNDFNVKMLNIELHRILVDENCRNAMLSDYEYLINLLGESGASEATADGIYTDLQENKL